LGVLMAEMGDGTQGLAKKSTPVRAELLDYPLQSPPERAIPDLVLEIHQGDGVPGGLMEIENLIRYAPLAVGLIEIEKLNPVCASHRRVDGD
jgi:hypothetical protein